MDTLKQTVETRKIEVFGFTNFLMASEFVRRSALQGKSLMMVRKPGLFLVGTGWEIKVAVRTGQITFQN